MKIDWFTILAQVLNFLILVWLLKRFLYKPILNAIDTREKKIAQQISAAAKNVQDAEKKSDDLKKKTEEFDDQRVTLMNKATTDAQAERSRLFNEAKTSAALAKTNSLEALRVEMQTLNHSIQRRAEEEVFAISRKVLADLAGAPVEELMVNLFIGRIHSLTDAQRVSFIPKVPTTVLVRTSFAIAQGQVANLQKAIRDVVGDKTNMEFSVVPELIAGIELTANGQRLSWSISDYLGSLEKSINELISAKQKPIAKKLAQPANPPLGAEAHGI